MAYPIIYYFSSPYCGPCHSVEKMLNEVNLSLFGNKLRIRKINIMKESNIAQKFKVISVPTIIIGDIRLSVVIEKRDLTDAILQGFLSSVSFEPEDDDLDPELGV
jgi:thiol-disulfide isomerase/thioredoxin